MFRSLDMNYVQVLLPSLCAEEFADRMAREKCMQFIDLNEEAQPFQRHYTGDIILIQEIERQIKTIEQVLDEYRMKFDSTVSSHDLNLNQRPMNVAQIIQTISKEITNSYKRLSEQSLAERQLKSELEAQENAIRVLSKIDIFLQSENQVQQELTAQRQKQQRIAEQRLADQRYQQELTVQQQQEAVSSSPHEIPLLEMNGKDVGNGVLIFSDKSHDVGFRYFAGVVSHAQRIAFERQVFLTSRGNSFVEFDESVDADKTKTPFVIFFLGDQLQRSLKRLCQFMNIQICYESDSERSREDLLNESRAKLNDFTRIHIATTNQLNREMVDIRNRLKPWKISLIQEKGIRYTLNKFRPTNNLLRAEGWCPRTKRERVQTILDEITANKGGVRALLSDEKPKGIVPTHFESNILLSAFQTIVNTYGVPRYKEFNPAVPTIVTFPFLFGVMYGDIFHGSFLFLFGIFLVFGTRFYYGTDKPTDSEMMQGLYTARYVVFLMGFFALYCGLIYNDCMSLAIDGWNKSQWQAAEANSTYTLLIQKNVYAFGLDPSWNGVTNQLTFENSLKMKLSVILGVTQMTFGLFLKLSNHIYENDMISVCCEFIPQFIFMMSFFGYMVFLIFFKWCLNWGKLTNLQSTPSLITVLIKMVLSPGSLDDTVIMYNSSYQKLIQVVLVLLMLVCVPWMLVPKPFLLKSKHYRNIELKKAHAHQYAINDDIENKNAHDNADHEDEDEEFEMSEVFIHQLIHTIEYVLGTVSNTASYLRLWALSLAHSQLSAVFYGKTLQGSLAGVGYFNVLESVITCFMFLMFTFGVLLLMDVLECFLHALRLHWVEFQSKFYYADGVAFDPFSYESMAISN